jgi:nucleoside phosphorylase
MHSRTRVEDELAGATDSEAQPGQLIIASGAVQHDMETAAIAQVARQNGLPWAALRMTSDAADESFNLDEMVRFGIDTAADLFDRVVRAVFKEL